jgi:DNA-binding transcriptional LysR family regulator
MVLLDAPPSSRHTLSLFERAGLEPNVRYRTTDFEVTRSLVGRGLGYSILVQHPAVDRSYEGLEIVSRPLTPAADPGRCPVVRQDDLAGGRTPDGPRPGDGRLRSRPSLGAIPPRTQ